MMYRHVSVMRDEVIAHLNCRPGKIYVDCTLGGAGHSRAILERIQPDGMLIAIDQDMAAIRHAEKTLAPYASTLRLFHDNYIHLPDILSKLGIEKVDGILADLGLSFNQIENSGRGFSFQKTEPLDMRMNADAGVTAAHLLNSDSEDRLEEIFRTYGEERWARQIARRIVAVRADKPITTTTELADIVRAAMPKQAMYKRQKHPATKIFMALRIAVNQELEVLEAFTATAVDLLNPGGRICFLAFHSLEDRIIKQRFRDLEGRCTCPPDFPKCICGRRPVVRILTKKALRPTPRETAANPMARSACLRAAEKLDQAVSNPESVEKGETWKI